MVRPVAKRVVTRAAFCPETQFCTSLFTVYSLSLFVSDYFALLREIGAFLSHLTNIMGQIQTWC